jgi:flagellar hook-associated protein 1
MSTFGGILSIARSGLLASQAAVTTASQNITNAQTPGYSRQRVRYSTGEPMQLAQGSFGTGVFVTGVERLRNVVLDDSYRRDVSVATNAEERRDTLQAIERVLGEPSSTGLASSLDQFWSAWSDLTTNPTSSAARGIVRNRGQQVAAQLNTFSTQLSEQQANARSSLMGSVERVNVLTQEIADINRRIVGAEAGGLEAPDLRDQRDLKVDELAGLVGSTAIEQPDGSVNVYLGGDTLVDGATTRTLTLQALPADPSKFGVAIAPGGTAPFEPSTGVGGTIAATLDAFNTLIPGAQGQLDELARTIVTEVNAIHTTGFVGATPAGAFFDATGLTAREIKLDATIASNAANIAAGNVAGESGNNTVALRLSQLRSTPVSIYGATQTIGEAYRSVVTGIANLTNSAAGSAESARTLASQVDTRRESVKGVSVDEEMVNLMKFQQSYAAAARLISVVDEMSQTLINLAR